MFRVCEVEKILQALDSERNNEISELQSKVKKPKLLQRYLADCNIKYLVTTID